MSDFSQGLKFGMLTSFMQNMTGGFGLNCFGGWGMNWNMGCCNWFDSPPKFFVPNVNNFNFTRYVSPMPDLTLPIFNYNNSFGENSQWSYSSYVTPSFDILSQGLNYNYSGLNYNFPSFNYVGDAFVKTQEYKPIVRTTGDFDKMLAQVLKSEGNSYVKNDNGSASKKGIKQETYDSYRDSKGLPKQDVLYITDEEVKDIYYNDFYIKSGANKITDSRMAFYVFDTAVNCGLGGLKEIQSACKNPNNPEEFVEARLNRYRRLAEKNPQKYGDDLKGWENRVENGINFVNKELLV